LVLEGRMKNNIISHYKQLVLIMPKTQRMRTHVRLVFSAVGFVMWLAEFSMGMMMVWSRAAGREDGMGATGTIMLGSLLIMAIGIFPLALCWLNITAVVDSFEELETELEEKGTSWRVE